MKRFWAKVDVCGRDECWLWQGTILRSGHGQVRFDGRKQGAHRVAYLLEVGDIPDGHVVHHLCAVPACCNPTHLATMETVEHSRWHQLNGSSHHANKTECGVCGGELIPRADGTGRWCRTCQERRTNAHRERKKARSA